MDRVLSVMVKDKCRDSLTDLLAMDFTTFFHLEMNLYHLMLREEESNYNQRQLAKRNNNS